MLNDPDTDDIGRMLRDSAGAITGLGGGIDRARVLRFDPPGFDRAVWQKMAELGWFGLRLSERNGGSALGLRALGELGHALGRVLTPEPLIETLLSARLLALVAPEGPLAAALQCGERVVLTAWQEMPDGLSVAGGPGARLFAPSGGLADTWLSLHQNGGNLELIARSMQAVRGDAERMVDGSLSANLSFSRAGETLGSIEPDDLAEALDESALTAGFYLCGLTEAALDMTLEYMRSRTQFDQPIGNFQVLQHKAVDQKIELELAIASCTSAASEIDAGLDACNRALVVSRAKSRASESALNVTRTAIQLHGGIGYADEFDIGLYLRKAMVLAHSWGSSKWHRRRFISITRGYKAVE
jgi:alkylation response protein AidB-like acyl-CoA dehydrogenase